MKSQGLERYTLTFILRGKDLMVFLHRYSGAARMTASLSEDSEGIFKANKCQSMSQSNLWHEWIEAANVMRWRTANCINFLTHGLDEIEPPCFGCNDAGW